MPGYEPIVLGNAPGDGLGNGLRTGGGKINAMFKEIFYLQFVLAARWHVSRTVYDEEDEAPTALKVDDLVEGWENNTTKDTWVKGVVLDDDITLPDDIRDPAKFFLMLDLPRL